MRGSAARTKREKTKRIKTLSKPDTRAACWCLGETSSQVFSTDGVHKGLFVYKPPFLSLAVIRASLLGEMAPECLRVR